MSASNRESDTAPVKVAEVQKAEAKSGESGQPFDLLRRELSSNPGAKSEHQSVSAASKEQKFAETSASQAREQLNQLGYHVKSSTDMFNAFGQRAFDTLNRMDSQIKDPNTDKLSRQDMEKEKARDLKELNIKEPTTPEDLTQAIIRNDAKRAGVSEDKLDAFMNDLNKLNRSDKEATLKDLEYHGYKQSYQEMHPKNGKKPHYDVDVD